MGSCAFLALISTHDPWSVRVRWIGVQEAALRSAQPRRPSAASRTIREDFQMAVGFLFLVLHKESETFLKFSFWITRNKRALLPILVAGT